MNSETRQPPDSSRPDTLAIRTRNLHFRWQNQARELAFPDIQLTRGEHLFLHGPSGTGKSTLLGLLAGMHTPSRGSLQLLNQELTTMKAGRPGIDCAPIIWASSSSSSTWCPI